MKRLTALFLCAAALFSLTACAGVNSDIAPGVSASSAPMETAKPTDTPLPYTDPLSGQGLEADRSALRPYAVMINNLEQALPQKGVSQAEILYEIPAEGGVTRMMALFTDVSELGDIGSMRSLRPYYAEIANAYDAVMIHAGGSEAAYVTLADRGMDNLDGVLGASYAADVFYRDPERMKYGYEHSLFSTGQGILAGAAEQGFDPEHGIFGFDYGLSFAEDADSQCRERAEYVRINYNGWKWTSFVYLPESGLYEAYEYGARYMDADSDTQLCFRNVLVLTTDISVIDDVGRLSVRSTGSGDGVFICGGKSVPITWERSDGGVFSYYLADGSPLRLGVGHSFIGVIGKYGTSVEYEKK